MISTARSQIGTVTNAIAVYKRTVPLLVGFGGGVNSMAALIALKRAGIRPDLITFADTGGEKPETYAYLDIVRGWIGSEGWPSLVTVKNASPVAGDKSLEAESLRRETMPSRAFGLSSCAMRWKIEPQEKFLRQWQPARDAWARGLKPFKVLGYDGGEQRRASITEDKLLRYWYPLLEWKIDREKCLELIESEGLPVPPKSACFFCPSSKKHEVLKLREEHPDLYDRAITMEHVALTSKRHELRNVKGLGRNWSWAEFVRMTDAEREAIPEIVESCMVCVDDSEDAA